jgi:NhaA family Na+:H+ antiporter
MPIFALANAGVVINKESFSTIMTTPVSIGIILGLFLGKQIGIFFVSYILVKFKIASLPYGVNKKHLYGASILGGIGFTMSIFVSTLSFSEEAVLSTAKLSIIVVSILSAIFGSIFFKLIEPEYENDEDDNVEVFTISDGI